MGAAAKTRRRPNNVKVLACGCFDVYLDHRQLPQASGSPLTYRQKRTEPAVEREVKAEAATGAAAVEATEAARAAGQEAEATGAAAVEATEAAVEREVEAARAAAPVAEGTVAAAATAREAAETAGVEKAKEEVEKVATEKAVAGKGSGVA